LTTSKPSRSLPNPHLDNLKTILSVGTPLLDVRAEIEFAQGALPSSINLPILNTQERQKVGTTYTNEGSEEAKRVGHALVSGEIKRTRVDAWKQFCQAHPNAWLTCWRGGMRSQIAQQWLADSGIAIERVPGGYKALRQACINVLESDYQAKSWTVLAGKTGSAKTVLINRIDAAIDLEGAANHRGSAFGAFATPQPTPATFENALAVKFLQIAGDRLVVEDESRTIGRLALPGTWYNVMQTAPLVVVELSLEDRVAHIRQEYVSLPLSQGTAVQSLLEGYSNALQRIAKRLGGKRCRRITNLLSEGFAGTRQHDDWITALITDYYDPMYEFQLGKKKSRIAMRGDHHAVIEYFSDRGHAVAPP